MKPSDTALVTVIALLGGFVGAIAAVRLRDWANRNVVTIVPTR